MKPRIPLLLINLDKSINASKRLRNIVKPLVTPQLKESLNKSRLKVKPEYYLSAALLNSLIYFLLFSLLFSTLYITQEGFNAIVIIRGFSTGLLFSLMFFIIFYYYPTIIANKIGETIDSELLFAITDMLVQVRSKVELYKSLINIVEGDYGYVSEELQEVVDEVESGKSMVVALKNLALRTKSDFMKRTAWQLMTSIKSGTNSEVILESIINELESHYHSLINNYTKELNVLTLIYLTLAVVAPTIGITVMIILSSFGGLNLTRQMIIGIITILLFVQPIVIGFINSRRPLVKI